MASVARPARRASSPTSQPSHGSETTGVSGPGAESVPANIMKRLQASSEVSTYCHPNEKTTRIASSGRSGNTRKNTWSHQGSLDGSSSRGSSASRRRSRESAIPKMMATASANAAPLASRSESGTSTWSRKDGMSSGARDAARRAVSARNRPAPATMAAPGKPWSLISGGPERTLLSGPFANGFTSPQSCILFGQALASPADRRRQP